MNFIKTSNQTHSVVAFILTLHRLLTRTVGEHHIAACARGLADPWLPWHTLRRRLVNAEHPHLVPVEGEIDRLTATLTTDQQEALRQILGWLRPAHARIALLHTIRKDAITGHDAYGEYLSEINALCRRIDEHTEAVGISTSDIISCKDTILPATERAALSGVLVRYATEPLLLEAALAGLRDGIDTGQVA